MTFLTLRELILTVLALNIFPVFLASALGRAVDAPKVFLCAWAAQIGGFLLVALAEVLITGTLK